MFTTSEIGRSEGHVAIHFFHIASRIGRTRYGNSTAGLNSTSRRPSASTRIGRDRFYTFLEHTWILQQVPVALVLFWIGGLPWIVWGVFGRVFVSVTGHWTVTYLTHNPGPGQWVVPAAVFRRRILAALASSPWASVGTTTIMPFRNPRGWVCRLGNRPGMDGAAVVAVTRPSLEPSATARPVSAGGHRTCRLTTACSRRPSQSSHLHTQICSLSGARLMLAVRRHTSLPLLSASSLWRHSCMTAHATVAQYA